MVITVAVSLDTRGRIVVLVSGSIYTFNNATNFTTLDLKGIISGKRLSNAEHNQHRKYQLLKGFVFLNLVLVYSVMNVSCLS